MPESVGRVGVLCWRMVLWVLMVAFWGIVSLGGSAWAADPEVEALLKEVRALRERVKQLEERLLQQEQGVSAAQQGRGALTEGPAEQGAHEAGNAGDIKDILLDRLGTLAIHGGVVGYAQGMTDAHIGGCRFDNPDGAGFVADLELTFSPVEDGEVFLRLHAGEGSGADRDVEEAGALFADLNTINDDNPDGQVADLLEVYYTHTFLDERISITVGKTEPVAFIDDNALANDEGSQFVGKPFVNDPVLDSEDEYGPLVAVGVAPATWLRLVALVQSSSHGGRKDVWDDLFEEPFLGGQVTLCPRFGELEGNWRLYAWSAMYSHPDLTDPGETHRGWGVGLSVDQQITPRLGLFGRLGYHNREVYPVDWFGSLGANLRGLIPGREEDEVGFGVAALKANSDLDEAAADTGLLLTGDNEGTEFHLEAYYRMVLSPHLALSPHLQYVIHPLGDEDNDDILAGMIRCEFSF